MPECGVRFIALGAAMFGFGQICGCIVKGVACEDTLGGLLQYGVLVPQSFAMAYVFMYHQQRLHLVTFLSGCWCLCSAGTMLKVPDKNSDSDPIAMTAAGIVLILYPSFSLAWHQFLLMRARHALKPYKRQYDELWQPIQEKQQSALVELAKVVARHTPNKQLQSCAELDHLMLIARTLQPWYQDIVERWASSLGLQHTS